MKSRFIYFVIPAIGLAGLLLISFIAYQGIEELSALKQQEVLQQVSLQIIENRPQQALHETDWSSWLKNNPYIKNTNFSLVLYDHHDNILAIHNRHNQGIDISTASELITRLDDNNYPYIIKNSTKYTWYKSAIQDTPYSILITHITPADSMGFYFSHLGLPIIIASSFVLWASIWLSLILSNLYKHLELQKQSIEHDAMHDPLTKLPNRVLFAKKLDHAIKEARLNNLFLAICILDLNRFKEINDALGHDYGDKLLVEVASRIKNSLRDNDTVARIGGDEFAILIQYTNRKQSILIAERISESLKSEFLIHGERFYISGSLGISFYPEHGSQPEMLIKHADVTMYHAKNLNYDYAIYNPNQKAKQRNTLFLYTELVQAVTNNEFEIYYQPKLDIKRDKVISLEALLRWHHPERGIIMPDAFISLAEQTGVIRDISKWVINRALHDQKTLIDSGINLSIAINLSAHNLDDDSIYNQLATLTRKLNLRPDNIILEITESAMMLDPESIDKILSKLKNRGYIISIDDFGTGYSSLRNLQKMHVQEIKIDRSFVSDMDSNENNARIVRGTIRLAHDLSIKVVAEGVESKAVVAILQALDCDIIQGHEICRPLPLVQFISKYMNNECRLSDLSSPGISNSDTEVKAPKSYH